MCIGKVFQFVRVGMEGVDQKQIGTEGAVAMIFAYSSTAFYKVSGHHCMCGQWQAPFPGGRKLLLPNFRVLHANRCEAEVKKILVAGAELLFSQPLDIFEVNCLSALGE